MCHVPQFCSHCAQLLNLSRSPDHIALTTQSRVFAPMDFESCGLVDVAESSGGNRVKSGGEKRRDANSFPRVLVLSRKGEHSVFGGMVVAAAYERIPEPRHHWQAVCFAKLGFFCLCRDPNTKKAISLAAPLDVASSAPIVRRVIPGTF